jgi:hypothetical protein
MPHIPIGHPVVLQISCLKPLKKKMKTLGAHTDGGGTVPKYSVKKEILIF